MHGCSIPRLLYVGTVVGFGLIVGGWTVLSIVIALIAGWDATTWLGVWFGAWLVGAMLFAYADDLLGQRRRR
jgi:hypothetical protein